MEAPSLVFPPKVAFGLRNCPSFVSCCHRRNGRQSSVLSFGFKCKASVLRDVSSRHMATPPKVRALVWALNPENRPFFWGEIDPTFERQIPIDLTPSWRSAPREARGEEFKSVWRRWRSLWDRRAGVGVESGRLFTWLWVKTNGTNFWVGAPPIVVDSSGDWDVHWGYDLDFDPWPWVSGFVFLWSWYPFGWF